MPKNEVGLITSEGDILGALNLGLLPQTDKIVPLKVKPAAKQRLNVVVYYD